MIEFLRTKKMGEVLVVDIGENVLLELDIH